jgi:hypothetical protein
MPARRRALRPSAVPRLSGIDARLPSSNRAPANARQPDPKREYSRAPNLLDPGRGD